MGNNLRLAAAAVLLVFGVFCTAASVLGVFKFRFVMNRMHCAAILDTLGLFCILCGLMFLSGSFSVVIKLLVILLLYWIGSPIAAHLVGKMEVSVDETVSEHMRVDKGDR